MGMRKARVDDAVIRDTEDELVTVNARWNSALDEKTIVRRVVECEEIDQMPV